MASILETCRELLLELGVFLWCTLARLVFALWFSWRKPVPLPAVTDKLLLRSATSLAADIRNGKVKSVDLVSAYIRRIREVQPIINAVVEERFEEALQDAKEADRLVASGSMSASEMTKEKPLLGLPFTAKNSIAIKGLRQDAGSLFWHGRRAEEDAPSVALLRAAGAFPLALTNVPELCMWGDSQNLVDGCTRNPHDTRRSPGGSSGGEGSLLAAAGSLIGLGTDIGGSVRIPAAYCGVFGHKPTAGVVPNTGLLPDVGENLEQFNCVGPMARFADDLPLMLNVLAGSATHGLRLNEKVNLKTLKLYYMETEGSVYISRVTTEARRAVRRVTQYLSGAHGLEAHRLHLPEMRLGMVMWFKVAAAKEPKPLPEMFRPGGFNTLVELLRHLVGAGRHTLAALATISMAPLFRFGSKQQAADYVASLDIARDRFEETLGENGVLVLPAATSAAPFQNQDLLFLDSPGMTALFNLFKVKSVDLVSAYIRRIREVQPIINAVVEERFEEALEDAKEVDRLVASGTLSSSQMSKEKPLLGLPFTAKNSIAIKGLRQDAGSTFWHGRRATEDAPSVALLRAAGAIPLALTNVCELCMWDDALNLVDGCTRNPHDTRRSPGGSSGGEGSLLAAAGSLIGLGTDIGGSVRTPAAYCGVFGHKPTAGVVPNTGLLPDVGENLKQFNCVGPMARFAEDLPLMLNVLVGSGTNGLRLNEKVHIKTLKLYYMDTEGSLYISRVTTEARRAVTRVTQYLKAEHGLEPQRLYMPEMRFAMFMWYKVADAMDDKPLAEMFRPGGFNTLVELLRYLVGVGRHTLAALAACTIMRVCRFGSKQKAEAYIASLNSARDRLEEALGDNGVLILPAAVSAAPFQNQDLLFLDSSCMTALFNWFKVPATVCPVMRSAQKLPLCVQVVAKRGNDRLCLAVAREIENRFGGWLDPSTKMQGRV